MPGRDDHGFVDISATALNAAISGSILAVPEACLVMMIALPLGSTRALATHCPGHERLIAVPEGSIRQLSFRRLDRPYKSLSAIARAITGTRWNGLVFFGLKNRRGAA